VYNETYKVDVGDNVLERAVRQKLSKHCSLVQHRVDEIRIVM